MRLGNGTGRDGKGWKSGDVDKGCTTTKERTRGYMRPADVNADAPFDFGRVRIKETRKERKREKEGGFTRAHRKGGGRIPYI